MSTVTPIVAAPAPVKAPKKKRQDAYVARLTISIPLDMTSADSLAGAIKAVQGIKDAMPAGALVEISGSLGKI